MKRLSKYIFAVIFAVIFAGIIFIPVSAMAADFAWLEAENGTVVSGAYEPVSEEKASGGGGMLLHSETEKTAQVDFTFSVSKNGDYDIKILTTAGDVDYLSRFSWTIDDGAFEECSKIKSSPVYNFGIFDQPVMWYSLGKKTLTAGEHTLSIKTEYMRFFDDFMYHYFDAVAIVPSVWQWSPDGIEKPVPVKETRNNAVWINVSDNTNTAQDGVSIDGASICVLSERPEGTVYEFPVTFKAPSEGNYDVYFFGSPSNADYATQPSYLVDGENRGKVNASPQYKSMGYGYNAGNGCGMVWEKFEKLALDTEEHTITFRYDAPRSIDSQYVFIMRYMVLVPSGTKFELEGMTTAQVVAEFIKSGIIIDCDYNNVHDDLALPNKTINGEKISWSSSDDTLIDKNGIVTVPGYYEEDKQVTLTAIFIVSENGESISVSKEFPLIVKKSGEYVVKGFSLTYPDGNEAEKLECGNVLTAKADVLKSSSGEGEAVMIVALYNKEHAMIAVNSAHIKLLDTVKSIEVKLPLEGDLSECTAEAFIWDGMTIRKLITPPIEIGGVGK